MSRMKATVKENLRVSYLNKVQLKPQFKKSLNLIQISLSIGYFKETNAFLVYAICFRETVHDKWCLCYM